MPTHSRPPNTPRKRMRLNARIRKTPRPCYLALILGGVCVFVALDQYASDWGVNWFMFLIIALLSIVRAYHRHQPPHDPHGLLPSGARGLPASWREFRRLSSALPGCAAIAISIFISHNKHSVWFMAILFALTYLAYLLDPTGLKLIVPQTCIALFYPARGAAPADADAQAPQRYRFRAATASIFKRQRLPNLWLICIVAGAFAASAIGIAQSYGLAVELVGATTGLIFVIAPQTYIAFALFWFFVRYSSSAQERPPLIRFVNIGGLIVQIGLTLWSIEGTLQFARACGFVS